MIIVFGSINVDLVMRVAHLPDPGETVIGGDYFLVQGGKGANQALAAARAAGLDNRVAMVGRTGPDDWAAFATAILADEGIDLSSVLTGEKPTGCATICVDDKGENAIAVASGANMEVAAEQVPEAWLTPESWLVLQMEVPLSENWRLIERARAHGTKILLNVAPAAPVPETALDAVDILVVNEHEARTVAEALGIHGDGFEDVGRALAERHGLACITTLGSEGVLAITPEQAWRGGVLPVTPVDTTGAGDAFVGTLAATLQSGASLPQALRRASVTAGLSCAKAGAQSSFPSAAEIESRLADLPEPGPAT